MVQAKESNGEEAGGREHSGDHSGAATWVQSGAYSKSSWMASYQIACGTEWLSAMLSKSVTPPETKAMLSKQSLHPSAERKCFPTMLSHLTRHRRLPCGFGRVVPDAHLRRREARRAYSHPLNSPHDVQL